MNTRDNQHGGIVIFAIIGILLVSLLAGALYVGRHQARLAEQDKPAPVAIDTEKDTAKTSNEEAATPPKEESKPAPAPSTPAANPQTPSTTPAPTTPRATVPTSGPSESLPAAGPSDVFAGIGVITTIAFVGFAFLQSSARLRRAALGR